LLSDPLLIHRTGLTPAVFMATTLRGWRSE